MKKKLVAKAVKDVPPLQFTRDSLAVVKKVDQRDPEKLNQAEDDGWQHEQAILRRAAEEWARQRKKARAAVPVSISAGPFDELTVALDDPSLEVRNEAVRSLYELDPDRAASFFNIALREGSPAERRSIGAALAGSGLVAEAVADLMGDSPENSYSAFSFLFLVAKAGEVQSLVQVIRNHPSIELRLTLIKLLASSGNAEIEPVFRLLTAGTLPPAVRAAIIDAINQLNPPRNGRAPALEK
jgi:hypothetical protein